MFLKKTARNTLRIIICRFIRWLARATTLLAVPIAPCPVKIAVADGTIVPKPSVDCICRYMFGYKNGLRLMQYFERGWGHTLQFSFNLAAVHTYHKCNICLPKHFLT